MATATGAYLENFGPVGPLGGKSGIQEIIWDFADKPVAAGDVMQLFLAPAGVRWGAAVIRCDKNPSTGVHSTIALGQTSGGTSLSTAVQPPAVVGDVIAGTVASGLLFTTTGQYVTATFASAQTTGKVTIILPVISVPTPYKFS